MIREILHLLATAPTSLRLMATCPREERYDEVMRRCDEDGFVGWREDLVRGLGGEVLEIGAGTGLMFPHYGEDATVTAVEPDEDALERARARAGDARARIDVLAGTAEALPFEEGRFDAVVMALVLCSIDDVPAALREAARVLRPGGEVRLIEHVRSERPVAGRLMDLSNPLWRWLNGVGCNLNRPAEATLREAGYTLREVRPFQIFGSCLPAFPMRWIRAVPPEG